MKIVDFSTPKSTVNTDKAIDDFTIKACENENQETSLPIQIPFYINDTCKAEQCYRTTAEIFNATVTVNMCCCGGYLCNCSPNALDMDRCANATIGGNDDGSGAASSNNNLFLLIMITVFILFGLHEI
uniref:UPAR/Ly6 domain-containing protein n=1 Tax=Ascaris lumbricoides TaxID=6252 RepID=A0A0M3HYM9_ASCLU